MGIKSKKGITEVSVIVVLAVVFAVFFLYSQGIIPKLTGLVGTGTYNFVSIKDFGAGNSTYSLGVWDNKLYAGTANGYVWEYNGTNWKNTGRLGGAGNGVNSLIVWNNKLYAGTADGNVSMYNGTSWINTGRLGGGVFSLAVYNNKLYAGTADGNVSVYDGTSWINTGRLVETVRSLAVYNNKLYAGTISNNGKIWAYNETTWSEVKSFGNGIQAFAVFNSKLYTATNNGTIWEHNGTDWTGAGKFYYGGVFTVWNDNLYAGNFSTIAVFDSSSKSWTDVKDLGGLINALAVYDNKLYAGVATEVFVSEVILFAGKVPLDKVILNITFPKEGMKYSVRPQSFEFTLNSTINVGTDLTSCEYSLSETGPKVDFDCASPITIPFINEGSHTWTIYLADNQGNNINPSVTFNFQTITREYSGGWTMAGGSGYRDRYSQVVVKGNTSDAFIIPLDFGNIISSAIDSIVTSKGFAYVVTDKNQLLKISLEDGNVKANLTVNGTDGTKLIIDPDRNVIYALSYFGGKSYYNLIDTNTMILKNRDEIPTTSLQNFETRPVLANNKIYMRNADGDILVTNVSSTDIQYDHTITLDYDAKRGFTSIPDKKMVVFIGMKSNPREDKLFVINTTNDSLTSVSIRTCTAGTAQLSDLVLKGDYVYTMCNDSNSKFLMVIDASNLSKAPTYYNNRIKTNTAGNAGDSAFAVSNERIYYSATSGGNDGLASVLILNPGVAESITSNFKFNGIGTVRSIVVSNDTVYAVTAEGKLYALNANNIGQTLWMKELDDAGNTPRLHNVIISSSDSILVLGKGNMLYKVPESVTVVYVPLVAGNEWVAQGGSYERKRYINTDVVSSTQFKKIEFDPSKTGGDITGYLGFDSVLSAGNYLYMLSNLGQITKYSLATRQIVVNTSKIGIKKMYLDTNNSWVYAYFPNDGKLVKIVNVLWDIRISLTEAQQNVFYINSSETPGEAVSAWSDYATCPDKILFTPNEKLSYNFIEPIVFSKDKILLGTYDRRHYHNSNTRKWGGCVARDFFGYSSSFRILNSSLGNFGENDSVLLPITIDTQGWNLLSSNTWPFPNDRDKPNEDIKAYTRISENVFAFYGKSADSKRTRLIAIDFSKPELDKVISERDINEEVVTEMLYSNSNLFFITNNSKLKAVNPVDSNAVMDSVDLTYKLNSKTAFIIMGDMIYYGSNDGKLVMIPTSLTGTINYIPGLLGNITTLTGVKNVIYAGTDKGYIYAIDNSTRLILSGWPVKVTTTDIEPGITSIIIPSEDSMLAVGGTNALYFFGNLIDTSQAARCGDGACDAGENNTNCAADCPVAPPAVTAVPRCGDSECIPPDTTSNCPADCGAPPNDEEPSFCRRSTSGRNSWWTQQTEEPDDDEPSENDCLDEIDGEEKECCPWGQTCADFGADEYNCMFEGLSSCSLDYTTKTACANYDPYVAFMSVDLNQGEGFCGSIDSLTGNLMVCKCSWDAGDGTCEPKWDVVSLQNGISTVLQTCQYKQCTESGCIGGIKTVSCNVVASGIPNCDPTSRQTSCYVPTEIPFFTLWNAIITIAVLAGLYYVLSKTRR